MKDQNVIRDCFRVGQEVLVRSGNNWYPREITAITVLRDNETHAVKCNQCGMTILGEPRLWFCDYGNVPLSDVMAVEDIDPYKTGVVAKVRQEDKP